MCDRTWTSETLVTFLNLLDAEIDSCLLVEYLTSYMVLSCYMLPRTNDPGLIDHKLSSQGSPLAHITFDIVRHFDMSVIQSFHLPNLLSFKRSRRLEDAAFVQLPQSVFPFSSTAPSEYDRAYKPDICAECFS